MGGQSSILLSIVSYGAIAFIAVLLIIYIVALCMAYLLPQQNHPRRQSLRATFESNRALNVGMPCSALTSFVLVISLLKLFGSEVSTKAGSKAVQSGVIEIKFFGLEFTGPSGPITLWALCFLCFIAALRMLRLQQNR